MQMNTTKEKRKIKALKNKVEKAEAVARTWSVKKVFLEISQNSQENTCVRVSFLIKLQACNFIEKQTLEQVFSCKFCVIPKNTFFHRTLLVAPSAEIQLAANVFAKLQAVRP